MSENVNKVSEELGVVAPEIDNIELDSNGLLKKRRKVSLDARKARAGYVFVLPFILGVLLIYLPILLDSIWFSMSAPDYAKVPGDIVYDFVGPEYYKAAFTDSC